MREDRSVLDLLTADYTFVNERLAATTAFPASTAATSGASRSTDDDAARAARPGQHSDRDVARRPARRRSSAASGCSRTCSARRRRRRRPTCRRCKENEPGETPQTHARADGAAPRESGLRELPQGDGSDRLRARELRRRRRVAHARGGRPDRRVRRSSPTARKVDGVGRRCARRCAASPRCSSAR